MAAAGFIAGVLVSVVIFLAGAFIAWRYYPRIQASDRPMVAPSLKPFTLSREPKKRKPKVQDDEKAAQIEAKER